MNPRQGLLFLLFHGITNECTLHKRRRKDTKGPITVLTEKARKIFLEPILVTRAQYCMRFSISCHVELIVTIGQYLNLFWYLKLEIMVYFLVLFCNHQQPSSTVVNLFKLKKPDFLFCSFLSGPLFDDKIILYE